MSSECGEFCVESASILRQLCTSRSIETQRAKFCKSKWLGSKLLKSKHVLRSAMQFLLISGLEVRVLRGSPLIYDCVN